MSRAKQMTCPNCDCAYCVKRVDCHGCVMCCNIATTKCLTFKPINSIGGKDYAKKRSKECDS